MPQIQGGTLRHVDGTIDNNQTDLNHETTQDVELPPDSLDLKGQPLPFRAAAQILLSIFAIESLLQTPADLLVLDMIMPGGMDGAETFSEALE